MIIIWFLLLQKKYQKRLKHFHIISQHDLLISVNQIFCHNTKVNDKTFKNEVLIVLIG